MKRSNATFDEWYKNFPTLGGSNDLKERFINIWDSQNRKEAEDDKKVHEEHPRRFTEHLGVRPRAVSNLHEEIFAYFDHPKQFTNAYTEFLNSVIWITHLLGRGCTHSTCCGPR